jgi:hypothetical protein
LHSPHTCYKWCKFGFDYSVPKGTLPGKQINFMAVSQLPFEALFLYFIFHTFHTCSTNDELLVAIG